MAHVALVARVSDRKVVDSKQKFIEDFSLFVKQFYHIVWNPKVASTKTERIMLLSKSEVSDSKNSKFIKQQEASGLLSSLGIKAPFYKIPLLGPILF